MDGMVLRADICHQHTIQLRHARMYLLTLAAGPFCPTGSSSACPMTGRLKRVHAWTMAWPHIALKKLSKIFLTLLKASSKAWDMPVALYKHRIHVYCLRLMHNGPRIAMLGCPSKIHLSTCISPSIASLGCIIRVHYSASSAMRGA